MYKYTVCLQKRTDFERRKSLYKKQTYMKTETCKLYSIEYFCQISSELILIIFELCCFKVGAFFETHCTIFFSLL